MYLISYTCHVCQVSPEMSAVHPYLGWVECQGLYPYWLQLERLKLNLTVVRDPKLLAREEGKRVSVCQQHCYPFTSVTPGNTKELMNFDYLLGMLETAFSAF